MDVSMANRWYGGPWYRQKEDGVHPRMDPASPESAFAVDRIRDQLAREIEPETRALDLGCGAGRLTFAMEKMGALATGVDCVGSLLEYARSLARQWNSRCTFVQADIHDLPFPPGSFELALLAMNIVECSYAEFARLVDQLARILVPGGKFCVEMRDSLPDAVDRNRVPDGYEPLTGICRSTNQAPGHDPVPVETFFWTPGFAAHVAERRFASLRRERTPAGSFWLVFGNGDPR